MNIPSINKQFCILSLAVAVAVAFHGWAIYRMHLLELDFYSTKNARLENQHVYQHHSEEGAKREQETKRRADELAVIFNELKPAVTEEVVSPYQNSSWQENFAQNADLSAPESHLDDVDISLPAQPLADIGKVPDSVLQPTDDTHANDIAPIDSTSRKEFIADLILATDKLQGLVLEATNEVLPTDNSIQIGTVESSSIQGNALESKEHMLEFAANIESNKDATPFNPASGLISNLSADTLALTGQTHIPASSGIYKLTGSRSQSENSSAVLPNSNTFHVQVDFVPQKDTTGYLFRVTLFPKEGIRFKRITQNYFFLVDRSHSIRPLRYELTKAAVSDALSNLYEGDTFNILVFDDHAVSMSPENIPATPENIAFARQFIRTQKYGGAFTTTDLYSSLGQILPKSVPEKEINTAILLSDGDTFLSRDKQRETIASWTEQNSGKMSLYCVPTGGGNNLPLLGLLSNFNKGSVVHARRDREVGTTLLSLIDSIQHPVGKDLVATAIVKTPATNVVLYPDSKRMPNLYENAPYTIYGSASTLDDFHLFIQGRYYDDYLDIKMHIDFAKAAPVIDGSIQQQIAQQRAYGCYEEYLRDGKRSHLNLAKRLLAPYRTAVPFQ